MIDFGKVCVNSSAAKNLVISNDLPSSIMVTLDDLDTELQKSFPINGQIIPSGGMAGYDIYFTSKSIGRVRRSLNWKVNGHHTFKVTVIAEVVPIEVIMNKTVMTIEFPPDSLQEVLTQEMVLTNPGNAPADFLWGSAGAFQCTPEKGTVSPGTSNTISITWTPVAGKRHEEELGLHITGGVDQVLKVIGVLPETKAEFVEKRIQLGVMAIGTEKTATATLKNTGLHPLAFFVNDFDERLGITVSPEKEIVQPGESTVLQIAIIPTAAMTYDNTNISVKVRGGKSVYCKLAGSSVIPEIILEESVFAFDTVATGSEWRLPFTITNKTSILSTLILDFSMYPDFKPFIKGIDDDPQICTQAIPNVQEDSAGNSIILSNPSTVGNMLELQHKKKSKVPVNIWKISLMPNARLSADLIFRPTVAKHFSFQLQLYLQGVFENKSLNRHVTATAVQSVLDVTSFVVDFGDRVVSRDPLSRVSYFLETSFKTNSSGVSWHIKECKEVTKEFVAGEMKLVPPTAKKDDDDDASAQIFFVSPLKGDLAPQSSGSIRITFQPQSSGDYSKKLDIYVKGQPNPDRPYLTLMCIGSGVFPQLTFSKQMVELPTVPLGVTSRAAVTVFNNGYNSLRMNYKVSPNVPVPLEITYPDGNEVNIMIDKIRIFIGAKSETPISWTGKIEFYDHDGERYCVNICGCSDGCLLTNYPFIRTYGSDYGFIALDDQPVKFLKNSQIADLRAQEAKRKDDLRKKRSMERMKAVENKQSEDSTTTGGKGRGSKPSSPKAGVKGRGKKESNVLSTMPEADALNPEGVDLDKHYEDKGFDDNEIRFLLMWLNKNVCRKPFDETRYPQCIIETGGDLVVDCMEQMSGRKIQFVKLEDANGYKDKAAARAESNKRTSEKDKKLLAANRLVFKHQQILNFLINNGALLGHVSPISLIGLEEHLLAQEYELTKDKSVRFTTAMLTRCRQEWEGSWMEGCKKAWEEVLYQALKVYVLSRVNYQDYSTMPGVVLPPNEDLIPPPPPTKGKKGAPKGPVVPRDLIPSNTFTHSEAVLMAWAAYHIKHSGALPDEGAVQTKTSIDSGVISFNKRLTDLDVEFKDLINFIKIIHSHAPYMTKEDEPISGFTTWDPLKLEDNFNKLQEAMEWLKIDMPSLNFPVLLSSTRSLLLMMLHMFLYLPHMIPKTNIEFVGTLGVPVIKQIELKNPSKKKISYHIELSGDSAFSKDMDTLTIPPQSSVDYTLTLNAKFFDPVTARLTFWGVREGGLTATSNLCFALSSKILGRKPADVISKNCHLFDAELVPLAIKNPFGKEGTFTVQLILRQTLYTVEEIIKGTPLHKRKDKELKELRLKGPPSDFDAAGLSAAERKSLEEDVEIENIFKMPFWCQEETLQLGATGTKTIMVNFLPFLLGKYSLQVVLNEGEIGEFCYEIICDVGLPKPTDKLEFAASYGKQVVKSIRLNSKSPAFEKAFFTLTEVRMKNPNKKIKARAVLQALVASPVTNFETGHSNFIMEYLSGFFQFKKQIPFVSEYVRASKKDESHGKKVPKTLKTIMDDPSQDDLKTSGEAYNTSMITFYPEKAGTYATLGVLYSKENPYDIRVLEVTAKVTIPDSKMALEFRGPAKELIIQDIPLTNHSQFDWNLKVTITGAGFTGPVMIQVGAGASTTFQVAFTGPYAGTHTGLLKLYNPDAGDTFTYRLEGFAEEALAEGNLVYRCVARKPERFTIALQKMSLPSSPAEKGKKKQAPDNKVQKFIVESDLPFLSGTESIEVSNDGANYVFTINSPSGGVFSGNISFRESETDATIWYTITVEVMGPAEERTIEVESTVRKAVAVEITLDNPTDEPLKFDVKMMGEGLLGESTFTLPPKGSPARKGNTNDIYELIFSPLRAGNTVGKISFANSKVGELWYKLNLIAVPAPPVVLDVIEAMVGTTVAAEGPIENPLGERVSFTVRVDDTEHFTVPDDKIILEPYAQTSFVLNFRPSSLNDMVSTRIVLSNSQFGEIWYEVRGIGCLPGLMTNTYVDAPLNEIGSQTIVFRNPFKHPLPLDVVLTNQPLTEEPHNPRDKNSSAISTLKQKAAQEAMESFELLLKKSTDLVVGPGSLLHISLAFSPKKLGKYESIVEVRSTGQGRNLLWCYPVKGIAEAGAPLLLPGLQTACKTTLLTEVLIPLQGIHKADLTSITDLQLSDFSVELTIEDPVRSQVQRTFKAQPLELIENKEERDPEQYYAPGKGPVDFSLRTRLIYEPLKVFTTRIEATLHCRNRGKWRVLLDLDSTEPEPDDVIKLCAPVGGSDQVTFRLSNRFLGYSKFDAFFSSKSSPHFTVFPGTGNLPPFGSSEGTPFTVTFSPAEYGVIEM